MQQSQLSGQSETDQNEDNVKAKTAAGRDTKSRKRGKEEQGGETRLKRTEKRKLRRNRVRGGRRRTEKDTRTRKWKEEVGR